jgi:hypothetical protein
LGIQIKLGEKRPCGSLINSSIFIGFGSFQIGIDCFKFRFNEIKEFFFCRLFGKKAPTGSLSVKMEHFQTGPVHANN